MKKDLTANDDSGKILDRSAYSNILLPQKALYDAAFYAELMSL